MTHTVRDGVYLTGACQHAKRRTAMNDAPSSTPAARLPRATEQEGTRALRMQSNEQETVLPKDGTVGH